MSANSKKRWINRLLILVAVLLVGTGAARYWLTHSKATTIYETSTVTRGEMTQAVTATGQLNPVTNLTVGCQISGVISKIYVDYNSPVTNGQVIAQIEPFIYDAAVRLAKADVVNAQAALELAQVSARRADELFKQSLIPEADHDTAVATLDQAKAALQSKEASLYLAQVNLDYCTIISPVSGTVISRNIDIGQTVAASLSAPTLFAIANDLTKMQIDASVAEADVGGIQEGQTVDFTVDAFPYRTFHGKVVQVRINPVTVQNVVTYDTVIGVDNSDLKLFPGMTANVSVITAHNDSALKLANAALRFRLQEPGATNAASAHAGSGGPHPPGQPGGGGHKGERRQTRTVYVLKDDKPVAVQVKIGISDGIFTEVTDGLNENDLVITGAIYKQGGLSQINNPFAAARRF